MGFLSGKKLLITGVISNRSIAYGIAKACRREGADLAFTYVGDRFRDRVAGFAEELGSQIVLPMDVSSDEQIAAVADEISKVWGGMDGFVHSIGFAPREAIAGDFLNPADRLLAGVGQVVGHHDIVAGVDKLHTGVAADIAGAAADQDRHSFLPSAAGAAVMKIVPPAGSGSSDRLYYNMPRRRAQCRDETGEDKISRRGSPLYGENGNNRGKSRL